MENDTRVDPGPAFEGEESFIRNIHRLFFRPRTFFAGIGAPKKRVWLYLFAFAYSLAAAIDRSGFSSMQGTAPAASWAAHWGFVGGAAFIGMFIVLYAGGAWYRFRLGLCGVQIKDDNQVKMVYLSAAQVYALPMIAVALFESLLFRNPGTAAVKSPSWLGPAMLVFLFWSIYTSYMGVRTVFKPKKAAAVLWFLAGPAALYVIMFGGMVWLTLSGSALLPGPAADTAHPQEFSNGEIAFSYPANWKVTEKEATAEATAQVQVKPVQDALIIFSFFPPQGSAAAHLEGWSNLYKEELKNYEEIGFFGEWGSFKGEGRVITGISGLKEYEARGFFAPIADDRYLMVVQALQRSLADNVQPGFDLIRGTFRCLRW